jgi:hypothetical protein
MLNRNQNKLHFCTLFDSNYLSRALAMYVSLEKYCQDFMLYCIAFDEKCLTILTDLHLPKMTVISLHDFEDPELLRVKQTRTRQEYCWTCSSSSILYCIEKYNLSMCTYVDADLLFFGNPKILLDEIKDNSIMLTEERLRENSEKIEKNGRYCVQFMPFKNDDRGIKALTWWRERCIEWCYNRLEDGKNGDQKYLDDWTERFQGVHVMENMGGGVAPWNMFQYNIEKENDRFFVKEKRTGKRWPFIFYHFHSTKIFNIWHTITAIYHPYDYDLDRATKEIYDIYATYIAKVWETIKTVDSDFRKGFNSFSEYTSYIKRKIRKLVINNIWI